MAIRYAERSILARYLDDMEKSGFFDQLWSGKHWAGLLARKAKREAMGQYASA